MIHLVGKKYVNIFIFNLQPIMHSLFNLQGVRGYIDILYSQGGYINTFISFSE